MNILRISVIAFVSLYLAACSSIGERREKKTCNFVSVQDVGSNAAMAVGYFAHYFMVTTKEAREIITPVKSSLKLFSIYRNGNISEVPDAELIVRDGQSFVGAGATENEIYYMTRRGGVMRVASRSILAGDGTQDGISIGDQGLVEGDGQIYAYNPQGTRIQRINMAKGLAEEILPNEPFASLVEMALNKIRGDAFFNAALVSERRCFVVCLSRDQGDREKWSGTLTEIVQGEIKYKFKSEKKYTDPTVKITSIPGGKIAVSVYGPMVNGKFGFESFRADPKSNDSLSAYFNVDLE